ncbi:LytTR family DNA-binding domain-containing protein [Hoeflea prorocentri]|uniref:LytTR family DNA-binding domain-containing protein n=1 Tax=Hoeflea prorocentri TaxID=1922333 RepID=A0A9X3UM06_9HYPH|nr:LytTR family DNA-binding domain-containing protein [Hoeflea prorocentri]MCY6383092.1 LytTR family DNA-binding domain-containing protein [Hoeflea prorocentri]MDA5400892.1 LytTR family DNA-binding domain-containing protein [Hoeflea prorocentri]
MHQSFANDPLAAHVKRQCAAVFGSTKTLVLLLLVAIFAGLSGPFGSYDAFAPFERHLFWLLVVAGTALAGHVAGTSAEILAERLGCPHRLRLPVAAIIAAMPVFGVVVALLFAFGSKPGAADLLTIFGQCAVVTMGIALLPSLLPKKTPLPAAPVAPQLISRLPPEKRGRLVRLAAQDHYVEVVTTRGRTLVAMRFRDAIAEAMPEPGAQIHRSHWVARHAVSGRCRLNGRVVLMLANGTKIPVGRKYRTAADAVRPE